MYLDDHEYYYDGNHIDNWQYSPQKSSKIIESILFVADVGAVAFVKKVNQYGVIEEAANLRPRDEPHREDEEGNGDKNNLQEGAKHSAKNTLLFYVGKYFECGKDAVAGGKDAKEEPTQRVKKVITNFSECHRKRKLLFFINDSDMLEHTAFQKCERYEAAPNGAD